MEPRTIRDLGAAFSEFQAHPSAAMWTYLMGRMGQYQSEWNDQSEEDAKKREETRQALCRVPGEPGRELVINTLNAKYLNGGGQRLGTGPCYCAVNESHPGVCQGADCYCHGEPGPRTDDDNEA